MAPLPLPEFRLEPDSEEGGSSDGLIWATGRAGEEPIPVQTGRANIVVEVEPPFRIGPVDLRPGLVTKVRGIYFPSATPAWRAWSVERRPLEATSEEGS